MERADELLFGCEWRPLVRLPNADCRLPILNDFWSSHVLSVRAWIGQLAIYNWQSAIFYVPVVKLLSHLTRLRRSKSESILPVPKTTEASGSSASETGKPVSMESLLSRFFSSAPPPVSTIPRSTMSAESSGGV